MRALLVILLLMTHQSAQAELFKWKDAEGNIIYSDQPPPGHGKQDTQIDEDELPPIISVPAPETSSISSSSAASTENDSKMSYVSLAITEPVHDTAVRENSGKVRISVRVEPQIFVERGDMLVIYMDGSEIYRGQQTSTMLDNVDRGTHTIKATLVNSRGQVIKETGITSFTLQRFHI